MEKVKIIFLGTGDSIPTKKRNHTSMLLIYKKENILIDCGEGTQRQIKIAKISPHKINKVLITHWHGDHTLGLLGLFQTLALTKYKKTLHIYGPKGTISNLKTLERFLNPYNKINLKIREVSGTFLNEEDFSITAMPMKHEVPSNAYSFKIKDKRRLNKSKIKLLKLPHSPLLKKLQQGKTITYKGKKISPEKISRLEKGKKITFILDTKMNPNAIKLAKNSDLLITESTFSKKDRNLIKNHKHLTSIDAATIAKKSKSKKLILIHISQRYEKNLKTIKKEAQSIFKQTSLAKDFDTITI